MYQDHFEALARKLAAAIDQRSEAILCDTREFAKRAGKAVVFVKNECDQCVGGHRRK